MQTASANGTNAIDAKVMDDLNTLVGKMDACDGILRPGSSKLLISIPKTDSTLEMIGFIEACAPRMVELVEAAAQGALSDSILNKCLEVNDRLTKILEDVDKITLVEEVQGMEPIATEDDFDSFLSGQVAPPPGDVP